MSFTLNTAPSPIFNYWEAVLSHLSCPRCNALMRREKIISDGDTCTSWVCTRCGEVVDQVILENRTLGLERNKEEAIPVIRLDPEVAG